MYLKALYKTKDFPVQDKHDTDLSLSKFKINRV